jgi:hypothetical protein
MRPDLLHCRLAPAHVLFGITETPTVTSEIVNVSTRCRDELARTGDRHILVGRFDGFDQIVLQQNAFSDDPGPRGQRETPRTPPACRGFDQWRPRKEHHIAARPIKGGRVPP